MKYVIYRKPGNWLTRFWNFGYIVQEEHPDGWPRGHHIGCASTLWGAKWRLRRYLRSQDPPGPPAYLAHPVHAEEYDIS